MASVSPVLANTNRQWRDGKLAEVSQDPLRFYEVSRSLFFEEFHEQFEGSERCRLAMSALMDRYRIRESRVLSLGPGKCQQEYFLSERGNQLLLVDIDELGVIEPALRRIVGQTRPDEARITYAIGDGRRLSEYGNQPFDVFVSFGFTPDEFHRHTQQQRAAASDEHEWGWPLGASTFSPIVLDVLRQLPDDGLFVSLSYLGGPDPAAALAYLPSMQTTLAGLGMTLLEVYALKTSPGVHLVVAGKGPDAVRRIPVGGRPLEIIHPRSGVGSEAVLIHSVLAAEPRQAADQGAAGIPREILAAIGWEGERVGPATCFYEGDGLPEVRALLSAGIDVGLLGQEQSDVPFRFFTEGGGLSFLDREQAVGAGGCDLLWLSSVPRDDGARREVAARLAAGEILPRGVFAEQTHQLLAHLKVGGCVLVSGHAALEVNHCPGFRAQLAAEFGVHGIVLEDLYVLAIATGIFLAVGRKASEPRKNDVIARIYPRAEDTTAIPVGP